MDEQDSESQYSDNLRCSVPSSEISSIDAEISVMAPATQKKECGNVKSDVTGQPKYRKRKNNVDKTVDKVELELMQSISSKLASRPEEKKKEKDEDDLFCELLATQVRKFNPRDKLLIKMQINNTVYNQLMKPSMNTSLYYDQDAGAPPVQRQFHVPSVGEVETRPAGRQFHVASAE